ALHSALGPRLPRLPTPMPTAIPMMWKGSLAPISNNPDSTPETFAMVWTCTDGNDNDRDGKRDLFDPGCRNTVSGSTPAPTATPAPSGPSDSGTNPGGSGSGSSGGSTDGPETEAAMPCWKMGAPPSRGPQAAERVQARILATRQALTVTRLQTRGPRPGPAPIPPQRTRPVTTGAASPGRFPCSSSCFC